MNKLIRVLVLRAFLVLFVRPFAYWFCRCRVEGRKNLPVDGPAILVANHNSHLDTFLVWMLFPAYAMENFRPVGSLEYLHSSRLLSFVSDEILRVIYIDRRVGALVTVRNALREGFTILLYPEGTRGEPGIMAPFEPGIGLLSKFMPNVPIVPIFIDGTGDVLPKGSMFPRFSRCRVTIGEPFVFPSSPPAGTGKEEREIASKRTAVIQGLVESLGKK